MCVCRLHDSVAGGRKLVEQALEALTGALFQRPPLISAVKRQLRIRTVYASRLYEYDTERNLAVLGIVRSRNLYSYPLRPPGSYFGCWRSYAGTETSPFGIRVKTKVWQQRWYTWCCGFLTIWRRKIICDVLYHLEVLLTNYKRVVVKDSVVNAICYGAKLMLPESFAMMLTLMSMMNVYSWQRKEKRLLSAYVKWVPCSYCYMWPWCSRKGETSCNGADTYPRRWGLAQLLRLRRISTEYFQGE